jgi:hypothetical protein
MGKRIALLIGVSEYENESNLPPCAKDIGIISEIISGSGNYDDCLIINSNQKSNIVKAEITSFIRKHQDGSVDEIFFYYTGHGTSITDDFMYLFSDFKSSKMEQTSLRNSEFDSMLKSLKPKQTIKVVDACQAGTEYIKSNRDLQTIFEKSSSECFKKTYFLFSSSNNQSSIALKDFSVFTKSFAMALLDYEGEDIRYRDIMDYISDDINVKKHQTPLFIQQADNTEIFCSVSNELVTSLKDQLFIKEEFASQDGTDSGDIGSESAESEEEKLVQTIKMKSREYCSADQAQESLNIYFDEFPSYKWSEVISLLFNIEVKYQQDYTGITGLDSIGKWIKDSEERYFSLETYTQEEYESKEKIVSEDRFGFNKTTEYRPVIKYRDVIDGFQLSAPSLHSSIIFFLQPKEEILSWYRVFFTHVFSKSKLTVFCKYEVEIERSWDKRNIQNKNTWKINHSSFKDHDSIKNLVRSSLEALENEIINEIKAKFDEE